MFGNSVVLPRCHTSGCEDRFSGRWIPRRVCSPKPSHHLGLPILIAPNWPILARHQTRLCCAERLIFDRTADHKRFGSDITKPSR